MKNRLLPLFFAVLLLFLDLQLLAQVSINTDGSQPDNSAILDVKSSTKGFLPPRMTFTEMYAIDNPASGLMVFCTDCGPNCTGSLAVFLNDMWYIFNTNCLAPNSPTAGINIPSSDQIVWNWNTVPWATGYKWNMANEYGTAIEMGTSTTKTETGLTCNTAYTRYVWAYNVCGNSNATSDAQTTSLNPPSAPIAGIHTATSNQIVWKWDTVADATGYKWSMINDYNTAADIGDTTYKTETGLTCDSLYTRYVWAYGNCGYSSVTSLTQTTLIDPVTSPAAGTHVHSQTQIVWNWNPVTGATGYKWNATNDYNTATDMGTSLTKTETGLTCNTPYIRHVWAYSACGNSSETNLNQITSDCFACGSSLIINHTAGAVAPVAKTVTYGTVYGIPGEPSKCWITSNLGADHQATAINDATEASAGWYWQFYRKQGYKHDGNTRTPNNTWFNIISISLDWISTNDPCVLELGSGWHVPTKTEWTNVNAGGSWTDKNGPWNSALIMHPAGYLQFNSGQLFYRGSDGYYWSNTQMSSDFGWHLLFQNNYSIICGNYKSYGCSVRCIKNTDIPTVTTTAATNITITSTTCGGIVTNDGTAAVLFRGVCWSVFPDPTISNSHTTDGSGTGEFASTISSLISGTLYYVRAYATNSNGTAYGNVVTFTTPSSVTTAAVADITQTTATSGGNVLSDGGDPPVFRGVCWNTNPNPTMANSYTSDGSGTGQFISHLTNLAPSTHYYVRAYILNSHGVSYGNDLLFTTGSIPICPDPSITFEGKTYNIVQIGTQCWLKENMNIGTMIPGSSDQTNHLAIEKYCYNNDEANCTIYGGLYQWDNMMQWSTTEGARGICPPGWHIPTNGEWTVLTDFLGGLAVAGGKLKEAGYSHWVPPNTGATNESGFTALPGGYRNIYGFYSLTTYAFFYSSSNYDSYNVWSRYLLCNLPYMYTEWGGGPGGYSVRCIRD